jgi:prepilin-type N-terminal cleavage/methylation domain-containing protein
MFLKGSRKQSGFTMVELLIVVIILGVLAAIAIPQFAGNTDDARLSALDTSLSELRNAIEMYYHQHSNVYPGAVKETDGTASANAAAAQTAFLAQLTLYSKADGTTSAAKDATFPYGPYLKKGLPKNPYGGLTTILCDIAEDDITAAASSGTFGWKFYTITGRLIANDGAHDAN